MGKKSKLNVVDGVIMGILVGSADAVETLTTLGLALPIIGPALPIIAWFYGFIISAIITSWLYTKGISIKWFLGGSSLDLIPLVNAVPAKTAALIATFIEDGLPEKTK